MSHNYSNTDWAGKTVKEVRKSYEPSGACRTLIIIFTDGYEVQFVADESYLSWASMPNDKCSNSEVNKSEDIAGLAAASGSVVCERCLREWAQDCEQAIRVEMFGSCYACLESGETHMNEVVHERARRLDSKGIHHDYDLRDYPINPPNNQVERTAGCQQPPP